MRFRCSLSLESPTALSLQRATGNDLITQRWIPGSVLRGALAQRYIEAIGPPDQAFNDFFLSPSSRFGDMRPAGASPWPLSVRYCSDHPQPFDKVHQPDQFHPITDVLLSAAANRSTQIVCACGAKTVPRNAYSFTATRSDLNEHAATSRRMAHSAIDPETLTVAPNQFHSARVLNAGQLFEGVLNVPDNALLQHLVSRELFLGRGRSRGQGRAVLRVTPDVSARDTAVASMVRRLRLLQKAAATLGDFSGQILFTCTLRSRAVFVDSWLLAKPSIDGVDLHPDLTSFQRLAAFARLVRISGWHAASKLPKWNTLVVAEGSCYLFASPTPEVERESRLHQLAIRLVELELDWVGERCEEGFGEVSFCNPVHSTYIPGAFE